MKASKKIMCRAFQKVMHVLIPMFPYSDPVILNSTDDVPDTFLSKGIGSVLLVTDKSIRELGLTASLEKRLEEKGIACHVYDKTVPNPTDTNVEEALAIYKSGGCQALIGFGGGSPMDCAKAVGAKIARPNKPLSKMAGVVKILHKIPLLVAIPTTSGTGSETTVSSVIVDSETHHKYVINDFCLIPKYAVLDPVNTASLPAHVTATTGMDALTHAVEAYIGKSKTKETRTAAIEAVKLIFGSLENAYNNGSDLEARADMLRGSYLAGLAFTKSYVGYVHAVAHTLGGNYNVPHGLANAVLLPKVLRAYGKSAHKSLAELAVAVGLADNKMTAAEAAERIISHIEEMNRRMNIPETLTCLKREDIPAMAKLADKEANPLYPVPTLWDAKELEDIYLLVYDRSNDDKTI